jgi:hypothetical protein
MRTVILVPRRPDGGRRDEIWTWVRAWLRDELGYPIYEGTDDGAVFSMAKARNNAARAAGDWDVALILDADTIAPPEAVWEAVRQAAATRKLVVAGDMRMRMDKISSDRIMEDGPWFPRPEGERHPKGNVIDETCYGEPSSGVIAIGRPLWDAAGGYLESLQGWGWEDLAFITQCYVVGDGMDWVRDSMLLHFYHDRTPITEDTSHNKQVWLNLHQLSCRDKGAAMDYLRGLGHQW